MFSPRVRPAHLGAHTEVAHRSLARGGSLTVKPAPGLTRGSQYGSDGRCVNGIRQLGQHHPIRVASCGWVGAQRCVDPRPCYALGMERELLVADSFRTRTHSFTGETEARGMELHVSRFIDAVEEAVAGEIPFEDLAGWLTDFFEAAGEDIAAGGDGFPRFELWRTAAGDLELACAIRPLPELGETLALITVDHATARVTPWRKGPNISRYAALNREVGTEALFVSEDGRAIEGATTSLLAWNPTTGHGHFLPGAGERRSEGRIVSVTEILVRVIAEEDEATVSFTEAPILARELHEYEVWAVNALHGIRVVTSVDGVPTQAAQHERLARFRKALDQTWQPV